MTNELEFYQKASELRMTLIKRQNTHVRFLEQLVSIYFKNGNKFQDELFFDSFTYRKIATIKEILSYVGFFNDERPIENYEFIKGFQIKTFLFEEYRSYYLIVRPKQQ